MAVFVAMIFLISSSGYMVYKSYCLCFGKEQVSVFVSPQTCESEIHHHFEYDTVVESACSTDECHECASHSEGCGCEVPEALFFKLQNQITNQDVKFVKVLPLKLFVSRLTVFSALMDEATSFSNEEFYDNPPPIASSSLDFLVPIRKLKIPNIA